MRRLLLRYLAIATAVLLPSILSNTVAVTAVVTTESAFCAASTRESFGTVSGGSVTATDHKIDIRDFDTTAYYDGGLRIRMVAAGFIKEPLQEPTNFRLFDAFFSEAHIQGSEYGPDSTTFAQPPFGFGLGDVVVSQYAVGAGTSEAMDIRVTGYVCNYGDPSGNAVQAGQRLRFSPASANPAATFYNTYQCNEPLSGLGIDICLNPCGASEWDSANRRTSWARKNRRCGVVIMEEVGDASPPVANPPVNKYKQFVMAGIGTPATMDALPSHQWKWQTNIYQTPFGDAPENMVQFPIDYKLQTSELTYRGHRDSLWRTRLNNPGNALMNNIHMFMGARLLPDSRLTVPESDLSLQAGRKVQIIRHDGTYQWFAILGTPTARVNYDGAEDQASGGFRLIQYYASDGTTTVGAPSVTLEFKDWEGIDRTYRVSRVVGTNGEGWYDYTMSFRDTSCPGNAGNGAYWFLGTGDPPRCTDTEPPGYPENDCCRGSNCDCAPATYYSAGPSFDVCKMPVGTRVLATAVYAPEYRVSAPMISWYGIHQRVRRDSLGVTPDAMEVKSRGGVDIPGLSDNAFRGIVGTSTDTLILLGSGLNVTLDSIPSRTFTLRDAFSAVSGSSTTYQRMRTTNCSTDATGASGSVAFAATLRGGAELLTTPSLTFWNPVLASAQTCTINPVTAAIVCDAGSMHMRIRLTKDIDATTHDTLVVPTVAQNGLTVEIATVPTLVDQVYYEDPTHAIRELQLAFSYNCPFGTVQFEVGAPCDATCPGADAGTGAVCSGHGTCSWTSVGNATCQCEGNWIGDACDVECPTGNSGGLDANFTVCSTHGTCYRDGTGTPSAKCACVAEWDEQIVTASTDEACNTNVKDKYCNGYVVPVLDASGFVSCPCPINRLGTVCEVSADITYCSNHGAAQFNTTHFTNCNCVSGWAGMDCAIRLAIVADACKASKQVSSPDELSFGVIRHNSNY